MNPSALPRRALGQACFTRVCLTLGVDGVRLVLCLP
jgi:hypothetical protein